MKNYAKLSSNELMIFEQFRHNKNIITDKRIKEMEKNNWEYFSARFRENDIDFVNRLKRYGFKEIKLYYTTTSVRGYYDTIAMVRWSTNIKK